LHEIDFLLRNLLLDSLLISFVERGSLKTKGSLDNSGSSQLQLDLLLLLKVVV